MRCARIVGFVALSLALVSSDVLGSPAEAVGNFSSHCQTLALGFSLVAKNVHDCFAEGKNTGPRWMGVCAQRYSCMATLRFRWHVAFRPAIACSCGSLRRVRLAGMRLGAHALRSCYVMLRK